MKKETEQKELKERLMAWTPGTPNFSRDDMILAVGFQCRKKRFPVKDVLQWLGPPAKSMGDASAGHLVYFFSGDATAAPMFDVAEGKIVDFGTISLSGDNSKRIDPETGTDVFFNFLDEMEPFNEEVFR